MRGLDLIEGNVLLLCTMLEAKEQVTYYKSTVHVTVNRIMCLITINKLCMSRIL